MHFFIGSMYQSSMNSLILVDECLSNYSTPNVAHNKGINEGREYLCWVKMWVILGLDEHST